MRDNILVDSLRRLRMLHVCFPQIINLYNFKLMSNCSYRNKLNHTIPWKMNSYLQFFPGHTSFSISSGFFPRDNPSEIALRTALYIDLYKIRVNALEKEKAIDTNGNQLVLLPKPPKQERENLRARFPAREVPRRRSTAKASKSSSLTSSGGAER